MFSRFPLVLVLPQLRNLNVLDLRHISELNNETVMEVVRKCRNLSSLNLCLNWSINDRFVNKRGGFIRQPTRRHHAGDNAAARRFQEETAVKRQVTAKCLIKCLSCHISSPKSKKKNLPAHIHELDDRSSTFLVLRPLKVLHITLFTHSHANGWGCNARRQPAIGANSGLSVFPSAT